MKHSRVIFAVLLLALPAGYGACGIFIPKVTPPPPPPHYRVPGPYNVIQNLATLYVNRDVTEYDSTLALDYVFRFVPDPITNKQDSLIRPEELNFADHLFNTGSTDGSQKPASLIRLQIDTVSSTVDPNPYHTGWIRYVVNTDLQITKSDGSTDGVVGPAVLFLKRVPPGSNRWRLAEWDDQPVAKPVEIQGETASRTKLASQI